jgi:flagellar motility protein MotE (MotC chaperone)
MSCGSCGDGQSCSGASKKSSVLKEWGVRFGVVAVIFGLLVGLGALLSKADASSGEKVKQKATETVEAASELAKETKQDFQKRMEKNLAEIEANISDLRAQASKTTAESRKKIDKELKELEAKRAEFRSQLDKVEESSGRAWTKFRGGVEKAWSDLKTAYSDAKDELSSDKKK